MGGNQILDYFNDTKVNWNSKDEKMRNTIRTLTALKHSQAALTDSKTGSQNPAVNWVTVSGNGGVTAYTRTQGTSTLPGGESIAESAVGPAGIFTNKGTLAHYRIDAETRNGIIEFSVDFSCCEDRGEEIAPPDRVGGIHIRI